VTRSTVLWRCSIGAALIAALATAGGPLRADEPPKPAPPHVAPEAPPPPADATTTHRVALGGQVVEYAATAGTLTLRNDKQEPQATIYYVADIATGPAGDKRPITFAFNGGPGAASAYLQLGAIGPRVIDFGDGAAPASQPSGLIDNAASWLDLTDLVFLDPVGTGYSHGAAGVDEAKVFWSVAPDLKALGEAISLYLARTGRTNAPVYLVGESYGGFRAGRLARSLIEEYGVRVAGVTMISPALDFGLLRGGELDPLPDALRLPSYAAVGLEQRHALSPEALKPAEAFALGDYLSALAEGFHDQARAKRVLATLADFSGLPPALVERLGGRIPQSVFEKEFRHDAGRILSGYDGSVSAPDPFPESLFLHGSDPILDGTKPAFTGAMQAYLRDELGFKTDRPYRLLNPEVSHHWDWSIHSPWSSLGAVDDLRVALSLNPQLRAVIAHGMTDLTTPYMTSRYIVDHLPEMGPVPRVTLHLYPGGHMMYLRPATRRLLHDDAAALYAAGAG
jgi:carboxypeptidase C (cathepsin A)